MTEFNKKEFQKTIASIRRTLAMEKYPKAMCTGAQMSKGTATVNCGGEWRSDTAEIADRAMQDPRFTALLAYYGATATLETGSWYDRTWTQIRIRYPVKEAS